MFKEKTLSIIKPDGVRNNLIGKIITKFEEKNLNIIASKMKLLSKFEAIGFYSIHREKLFFNKLINFMCSGPVLIMILYGEDAIKRNRQIIGNTNPKNAIDGTIRKMFSKSIDENTVHGSDSLQNAKIEIEWFFSLSEIHYGKNNKTIV